MQLIRSDWDLTAISSFDKVRVRFIIARSKSFSQIADERALAYLRAAREKIWVISSIREIATQYSGAIWFQDIPQHKNIKILVTSKLATIINHVLLIFLFQAKELEYAMVRDNWQLTEMAERETNFMAQDPKICPKIGTTLDNTFSLQNRETWLNPRPMP